MYQSKYVLVLVLSVLLVACGGGGGGSDAPAVVVEDEDEAPVVSALDTELLALIAEENLSAEPEAGRTIPSINDPLPQLGRELFFTQLLGGEFDAACVSCHHPVLGGADQLSLSVGVAAVDATNTADAELLGLGRFHQVAGNLPSVPRNAPTIFNVALQDSGLFWDSRVASVGEENRQNGSASGIITPDSLSSDDADTSLPTGTTLPAAQARFPVTSADEMRGSFSDGTSNTVIRNNLASRFASVGTQWPQRFIDAFGDSTVTFDRIALAIGEYERSMLFVDNPWRRYVAGDSTALSDQQKAGAILFFTPANQGGADCLTCHRGDTFSDDNHHLIAFPQIGPGKGDTSNAGATDDFGREQVTGRNGDRYHFKTPSLLNVAVTAPYGHAGSYQTLEEVVRHYVNPAQAVDQFFGVQSGVAYSAAEIPFCDLPQIAASLAESGAACSSLYPDAYSNSLSALDRLNNGPAAAPLRAQPNLNDEEVAQVVAFLQALTDPCVQDRVCLNPWIVDADDEAGFPDGRALIAHDRMTVDF